ncbi:hypothetical protein EYF80_019037 [Liparis tanakae]|uniref:Uncharacterized protein n=1 Tax=Liparis tanakae TaxID=230148 RepID=A0A4Z2I0E9_9TELE|nr:hypothetical protein EYF80_019037 [Liparis tanakae]
MPTYGSRYCHSMRALPSKRFCPFNYLTPGGAAANSLNLWLIAFIGRTPVLRTGSRPSEVSGGGSSFGCHHEKPRVFGRKWEQLAPVTRPRLSGLNLLQKRRRDQ